MSTTCVLPVVGSNSRRLVSAAVSQPLYPFGHAGIMHTTNDISTLLNLFWQYFKVKVNVLHIELSEKKTELLWFLLG